MTFDELFRNTFRSLSRTIDHTAIREQVNFMLPSMPMVKACRADEFDFFQPLIDAGDLSGSQMHHAAHGYYLGKSRSGIPIFWMIDELGYVLDGHILQDHTVTIYPRTDPTMSNHLFFLDFASQVRQAYPSIHLTIDETLEEEASESQKSRCIDLLDFLLE